MRGVTPAQAVAHPNWSMGAKISVDSATLMNKGLELIEAFHLFPVGADALDAVIHPQSIVHSLVEYVDGSLLAQLGPPDMRVPIAHALAWPARMATPCQRLDLVSIARLDFEAPDPVRFPALALAREALVAGGAEPAILNAANEVAVASFLESRIGFLDIASVVGDVLAACDPPAPGSIDAVLDVWLSIADTFDARADAIDVYDDAAALRDARRFRHAVPAFMNLSFDPLVRRPFITRTLLTTPRYWSNWLSKINACSGASGSPFGAGMRSTTASSSSGTPTPVLAEIRRIWSAGMP